MISADAPTYCVLFESISNASAIAKGAMFNVEIMLNAGWRVTAVTKLLAPELRDRVEWIPLYVPPRLYALQWLTARWFYKKALGSRTFDVIHAHQPQVADLADIFQCHFITRVAYERKCLRSGGGFRGWLGEVQAKIALPAEDYFFRHRNPNTRILFNSELTRQEFIRLYAKPPLEEAFLKACPAIRLPSAEERSAARRRFVGDEEGIVLGYLGGIQERKGYRRVVEALKGAKDIILLAGGSHGDGFNERNQGCRMKFVGLVSDTAAFYAACDVFIVPSLFEPLGMVAFEAAARGVPVVCTPEVGAVPHFLQFAAGEMWLPDTKLAPLVRHMAARRKRYLPGIIEMSNALSEQRYAARLLKLCNDIAAAKQASAVDAATPDNGQPSDRTAIPTL